MGAAMGLAVAETIFSEILADYRIFLLILRRKSILHT